MAETANSVMSSIMKSRTLSTFKVFGRTAMKIDITPMEAVQIAPVSQRTYEYTEVEERAKINAKWVRTQGKMDWIVKPAKVILDDTPTKRRDAVYGESCIDVHQLLSHCLCEGRLSTVCSNQKPNEVAMGLEVDFEAAA